MTNLKKKKLLVVAPHVDDELIGCGGLIKKIMDADGQVYVLYLSVGSTADFGGASVSSQRQRIDEIDEAVKYLRITDWRVAFPGDDYHLRLDTVPQRELIHEIEAGERISLEAVRPDIVAFPAVSDYNQDHRAAALASLSACRPAMPEDKFNPSLLLGYESPMNGFQVHAAPQMNWFLTLTETEAHYKAEGMQVYASQVRRSGHPRSRETLLALAQLRGSMVGSLYAEAYFCHRSTTTV